MKKSIDRIHELYLLPVIFAVGLLTLVMMTYYFHQFSLADAATKGVDSEYSLLGELVLPDYLKDMALWSAGLVLASIAALFVKSKWLSGAFIIMAAISFYFIFFNL